jgi:RNA polymerase sigma factor (sigma-70 family)
MLESPHPLAAEVHTGSVALERTDDFGAIYEENYRLLVGTAVSHYHISEIDAQSLAHEVFLAYFLKAHEVIDSQAWLFSAIRNASKYYLRARARYVALTSEFVERPDPSLQRIGEALPDQLAAREAFSCLTARCQVALRLRYLEGYSIPEVAAELNTSHKYAQKLVSRCLRQAKDRYRKRGELERA